MGILDNNLVKTQGRTKRDSLFTELSGVSSYTSNKIDCRGYNTLILGLTAYTNAVDTQIVGIYSGATTLRQKVYGIDITKSSLSRTTVKIDLSNFQVPVIGDPIRIMIDVSAFEYIGVGKIIDNSNTLTCVYSLIQKTFNIDDYEYNRFNNIVKSITTQIYAGNSKVYFDGVVNKKCSII